MSSMRRRAKRSASISEDRASNNVKHEEAHPIKEIPSYGTKKCHEARDSLFSSQSGFDDYRGFLNLCVIMLVISNARSFVENILKYGILVDPIQWMTTVLHNPYQWPNVLLMLASHIFILISFHIERVIAQNKVSSRSGKILHSINLFFCILAPPVQILNLEPNPIGSVFSCGIYVILFLKLWSYAQANSWYREDYVKQATGKKKLVRTASVPNAKFIQKLKSAEAGEVQVQYPYNLTYKNLYYFIFAPTLCYELNYPRTKSMNRSFLLRRIIEALFLVQLELALCQQWIVPTLQKAIAPIHHLEGGRMLERLLRLAVPNHIMWLIFFYCFFHSLLNILAELLRFADREFYRDWWNSETIEYFWKAWNIPVHKWCTRHVYKPLLKSGVSKFVAQLGVFLLSAFFHEYLVSIPLHVFRLWAFMGMVAQVPMAFFTIWVAKKYSGRFGNMLVWLSLMVGQPMAILAYVYHYYVLKYGEVAASGV